MKRLLERAALDARSLAAGRVVLALLLLVDLAQRASDLTAHYTDQGVLPRAAYALSRWDFAWSLHTLGGSTGFQAALFALAAVSAVALLLGYRTFWATAVCWLLTVSLHGRNPLLRDGQDDLSRVLLFWALFLPIGAWASADARAGRRPHPLGVRLASAGALCLVLQLLELYWTSALGKLQSPWWLHGDGVYFALRVGRYQTAVGEWLSVQPGLRVLSFATWALEACGVPVWLAVRRWEARAAVVGSFLAMHAGFALCMGLGLFPFVCMAAWLFLVPGELWERLGWRAVPAASEAPRWRACAFAGAAGVALAVTVWCNALYLWPELGLPRWPQRVADGVGLQQYWVLFSPRSSDAFSLSDGWLVIPAVLKDGRQVDLETRASPPRWEKPERIPATLHSARWRHYFANIANLLRPYPRGSVQFATLEDSRAAYGRWLCTEWNGSHPKEQAIQYLSLVLMRYRFDLPGDAGQREILYRQVCSD